MNNEDHYDRIERINEKGEILLPIGHYALINNNNRMNNHSPIISIYGLGSCIALILYDSRNNISGMSHILLPKSDEKKEIKYPHKFADLSANYLIEELVLQGAQREYIHAIIVGGSKIFDLSDNIIGEENIKSIKQELDKLNINITIKSLGGTHGRIIKFNTKNLTVSIKFSGENEFQEL